MDREVFRELWNVNREPALRDLKKGRYECCWLQLSFIHFKKASHYLVRNKIISLPEYSVLSGSSSIYLYKWLKLRSERNTCKHGTTTWELSIFKLLLWDFQFSEKLYHCRFYKSFPNVSWISWGCEEFQVKLCIGSQTFSIDLNLNWIITHRVSKTRDQFTMFNLVRRVWKMEASQSNCPQLIKEASTVPSSIIEIFSDSENCVELNFDTGSTFDQSVSHVIDIDKINWLTFMCVPFDDDWWRPLIYGFNDRHASA